MSSHKKCRYCSHGPQKEWTYGDDFKCTCPTDGGALQCGWNRPIDEQDMINMGPEVKSKFPNKNVVILNGVHGGKDQYKWATKEKQEVKKLGQDIERFGKDLYQNNSFVKDVVDDLPKDFKHDVAAGYKSVKNEVVKQFNKWDAHLLPNAQMAEPKFHEEDEHNLGRKNYKHINIGNIENHTSAQKALKDSDNVVIWGNCYGQDNGHFPRRNKGRKW